MILRTGIFIANWIVLLTIPVWGGALILAFFIFDLFAGEVLDRSHTKQIAVGKRWFFNG